MKAEAVESSNAVIEFFGLPGVGKSYMAGKFSHKYAAPIISVQGRLEKYFLVAAFAFLRPRTFLFFLKEIVRENRRNAGLLHHKIRNIYFDVVATEQKSSFTQGARIIDQGFFLFLISLYERKINASEIEKCLGYFKKNNYYVFIVEADDDIRKKRMRERGRIPRSSYGREYIDAWFPILEHNYKIVKEAIKNSFPNTTIANN